MSNSALASSVGKKRHGSFHCADGHGLRLELASGYDDGKLAYLTALENRGMKRPREDGFRLEDRSLPFRSAAACPPMEARAVRWPCVYAEQRAAPGRHALAGGAAALPPPAPWLLDGASPSGPRVFSSHSLPPGARCWRRGAEAEALRPVPATAVVGGVHLRAGAMPPRGPLLQARDVGQHQAAAAAGAGGEGGGGGAGGSQASTKCDKCDGAHPTDACPHFKKPREEHKDAWVHYGSKRPLQCGTDGGNYVLRNAQAVRQPGDGSCLFHSLCYGLHRSTGSSLCLWKDTADDLRREIARFIKDNPQLKISGDTLEEWVRWDSNKSCDAYAKSMAAGGWGGGIEMAAFSKLKNVGVHVYERTQRGEFRRISCFEHPEAKAIVNVLYQGGMHYDAIVLSC